MLYYDLYKLCLIPNFEGPKVRYTYLYSPTAPYACHAQRFYPLLPGSCLL